MKTFLKSVGTLVLVLFAALASSAAMAQHHGGHGGGHGNVRFGISLGFPLFGPAYYPAPYYAYPAYGYAAPVYGYPAPAYGYPPAAVGAYSPPTYAEQSAPQAAPAPSQAAGDWYYCPESKAYYPYVSECPAGWQRVPAQPPSR